MPHPGDTSCKSRSFRRQAFGHGPGLNIIGLQFSGFWVWTGTTPLTFLGLQLANSRSWDFSASVITVCSWKERKDSSISEKLKSFGLQMNLVSMQ
ncbi:uncharacterized protein RBU33_022571 isoform 2-T2 [Hipposideros larvatus]